MLSQFACLCKLQCPPEKTAWTDFLPTFAGRCFFNDIALPQYTTKNITFYTGWSTWRTTETIYGPTFQVYDENADGSGAEEVLAL